MNVKFSLKGDKEIKALMDELGHRGGTTAAMRAAVRKGLDSPLKRAKALVPKDTGALRKALGKIISRQRSGGIVGKIMPTRARLQKYGKNIEGKGYYPAVLEFGTVGERHHKSGKSTGAIAPLGFMRRSFDATVQQQFRDFDAKFRGELRKKVAKKRGR